MLAWYLLVRRRAYGGGIIAFTMWTFLSA